jgi:hypothetical protein
MKLSTTHFVFAVAFVPQRFYCPGSRWISTLQIPHRYNDSTSEPHDLPRNRHSCGRYYTSWLCTWTENRYGTIAILSLNRSQLCVSNPVNIELESDVPAAFIHFEPHARDIVHIVTNFSLHYIWTAVLIAMWGSCGKFLVFVVLIKVELSYDAV